MCFSSGSGGMELDAIKLARLLGKEMEVVLLCKEGEFIHHSHQGVNREYDLEPVGFSSRTFSLSMLLRVRSLIKQYSFDNVVFFGASELKTLYFAFLSFDLNVIVRHGTTKSRPKKDWLHRLVYSCVNHHVVLSEHLLRNVRQIMPSTSGVKFHIIYSSFEFREVVYERITDMKGLVISCVGRIIRPKGQIDAVIACAKLRDAGIDFTLELLGGTADVDYEKDLKLEINRLGLNKMIRLRGHVTNVTEFLSNSDIFLLPSAGEGMPNAFIEALHYGVPCLAYSNTVFPEFLEMGFHVTLAINSDIDDLAGKLVAVAENIEDERRASNINKKLAIEYFNTKRELDAWREVLK